MASKTFPLIPLITITVLVGFIGLAMLAGEQRTTYTTPTDFSENHDEESYDVVDEPYEPEEVIEPVKEGEWAKRERFDFKVICSEYRNTGLGKTPNTLLIHFVIRNTSNWLVEVDRNWFYAKDESDKYYRQTDSYSGRMHLPEMSYTEKFNPEIQREFTLYIEVPGPRNYQFNEGGPKDSPIVLSPAESCRQKIMDAYNTSGLEEAMNQ